MIRQFIQNKTGFAKKDTNMSVKVASTDIFGNVMSDEDDLPSDEIFYHNMYMDMVLYHCESEDELIKCYFS